MITPTKLPKKSVTILSELLKKEYEAHRMYRYVSNCLRNKGYNIAAAYYAAEAESELKHAEKLQKFASDWNVELSLLPLGEPDLPENEETLDGIVSYSYKMENDLLQIYKKRYIEHFEDGDLEVAFFLQEFVNIQCSSVVEVSEQINAMMLFDQTDKNWLYNFEKKVFKN